MADAPNKLEFKYIVLGTMTQRPLGDLCSGLAMNPPKALLIASGPPTCKEAVRASLAPLGEVRLARRPPRDGNGNVALIGLLKKLVWSGPEGDNLEKGVSGQ